MRVVVAREFGNSISESMAEEIKQAAMIMGIENDYIWTDKRITHKRTKSVITFLGLERNKGSIKGLSQIDLCVVEEAQDCSQGSLDVLLPTIRKKGAQVWFILNPRDVNDAVAKTFIVNDYPETLRIQTTWQDNRFFTPKLTRDMEAMKALDEVAYRNIWLGEFVGAEEMALIKPIVIQEARKRRAERNETLKIVAGFDVAGEGKDRAVIVRRRGNEVLSVHKYLKGDTTAHTEWAKEIFVEYGWDHIVVDCTGSTGIGDNLEVWGSANRTFTTTKWNASRSSRAPIKYTNARTESWGIMRDWLRVGGAIGAEPEWDELSGVLYKWTTKEQIALESKKLLKRSPDYGDALALSLWKKDEVKAPKQHKSNLPRPTTGFFG